MKRHAAHWMRWLQWALAVSIVAAVGWPALHALTGRQRDTLYITIGELRSRAAEMREIAHNASAGRLTANYVRAQCAQLAQRIASIRDDLAKAAARGAPRAATARPLAERLLELTRNLAERGESVTVSAKLELELEHELEAIVAALIPLEQQATPQAASVGVL